MQTLKTIDVDGLYPQQRKCVTAMTDWYNSPSLEFTLKGYAGTGKTHAISVFLKTIGAKINYCVTAPTHKALHVIEKTIKVKGKTLHSLHGLRLNVDLINFNIENPQFDPSGTPHIQNYRLIVIDEASMINSGLFELNRYASKLYKTKVLYVGDPLQLPPVNETVGKVFTDVTDSFELTDILRQGKDHDLLELFTLLRDDIINGRSNCITHLIKSKDKHISNDYGVFGNTYGEEIVKKFTSPEFTKDIDYIREGSFTRNNVAKWNSYIRQHVIGSDEQLTIHDMLTAYTNQVDSLKVPIITNSEDYIMYDIDRYVDNLSISTFAVNLQSVYNTRIGSKLLIADHTDENSFEKIKSVLNHLHYLAYIKKVPKGFRNYFNFKDRILLMKDIVLNKDNNEKKVSKDIDYGYALTIHKLQGSTMRNIAIDLHNIVYPTGNPNVFTDVDTRNRLLYVGLSRASEHAIIHY